MMNEYDETTTAYDDLYGDPYASGDELTNDSVLDSWRHPVNVGHLVMGLAFLGLVLVWALIVGDVVPNEDVRWLLPVPWVLAGGAGLVAMTVSARRRSRGAG
jgi:hypothetical protein